MLSVVLNLVWAYINIRCRFLSLKYSHFLTYFSLPERWAIWISVLLSYILLVKVPTFNYLTAFSFSTRFFVSACVNYGWYRFSGEKIKGGGRWWRSLAMFSWVCLNSGGLACVPWPRLLPVCRMVSLSAMYPLHPCPLSDAMTVFEMQDACWCESWAGAGWREVWCHPCPPLISVSVAWPSDTDNRHQSTGIFSITKLLTQCCLKISIKHN